MWWFLRESYRYVWPRGFVGHMKFAAQLPRAAWRFYRTR
jgi:hypothetical protein